MSDLAALQKGVRIVAGTAQELESALKARCNEIAVIAKERRPSYAQGKLSEKADGIWSGAVTAAVRRLDAVGVQLNGIWAQLPPDWHCPCCKRPKKEIMVRSDEGILVAHAVEHHDHFISYVAHSFREQLGKDWSRNFHVAGEVQRRLSSGVVGFDKTVICESCNFADGQAKIVLRRRANVTVDFLEYFSFALDEIRCFIRPIRNSHHALDEEAIVSIFEERRKSEVMDFRKKAVDVEVKLLKDGLHWRSAEPPSPNSFEVQEVYVDAILEFGMEDGGNFSLCDLSATDQGLKIDPNVWITMVPKKESLVSDREAENFIKNDIVANQIDPGWRCPCCNRSLAATLRRNNKRKVTFQPHSVRPNRGEAIDVCLDCHTSMIRISASASSERDDVDFDDVREVFTFRRNLRHCVRSPDVAYAVIEQVRMRNFVLKRTEADNLNIYGTSMANTY